MPFRRPRILIVDDNRDLLAAMAETLQLSFPSSQIDTAPSAPEGLERAAANRYDVVLCDYRMPGGNGMSLLNELKTLKPNLPVILVTADTDETVGGRAYEEGAFGVLLKPLDSDELIRVINQVLERADTREGYS
jgi:CheY-like chemotaxis protein